MGLGTGIFLGLIFIGLIWLYVVTWQRWRWKRIVAWCFDIVSIPVLGFGIWMWVFNYMDSFPRPEMELWDLKPGMTIEDVVFRKGEPNQKEKDYWFYMNASDEVGHLIRWTDDRRTIKSIEAVTQDGKEYNLPSIQGIGSFSTQENIEQRFGKPDNISVHKDQTRRMLSYLKYGVAFHLERNRVTSIAVVDGKRPARFKDEATTSLSKQNQPQDQNGIK